MSKKKLFQPSFSEFWIIFGENAFSNSNYELEYNQAPLNVFYEYDFVFRGVFKCDCDCFCVIIWKETEKHIEKWKSKNGIFLSPKNKKRKGKKLKKRMIRELNKTTKKWWWKKKLEKLHLDWKQKSENLSWWLSPPTQKIAL